MIRDLQKCKNKLTKIYKLKVCLSQLKNDNYIMHRQLQYIDRMQTDSNRNKNTKEPTHSLYLNKNINVFRFICYAQRVNRFWQGKKGNVIN